MKWGKVEDIGREAHLCEETRWIAFKSTMHGYWLIFMAGQEDERYGPYEDEAEAKKWAERLHKMSLCRAEEKEEAQLH